MINWEKKPYGYTGYAHTWRFDICATAKEVLGVLFYPPNTLEEEASVKLNIKAVDADDAKFLCEKYAMENLCIFGATNIDDCIEHEKKDPRIVKVIGTYVGSPQRMQLVKLLVSKAGCTTQVAKELVLGFHTEGIQFQFTIPESKREEIVDALSEFGYRVESLW